MTLFDRRTETAETPDQYWQRSERQRIAKAAAAAPAARDPRITALIAAIHRMSPDLSVAEVEQMAAEIFRDAGERARVTRVGQQREQARALLASHAQAATVRAASKAALDAGADAVHKCDPSLPRAAAFVKFMQTDAGRALVALHRSPDADLSVAEYDQRQAALAKRAQAGFQRWGEAVDLVAKSIQVRDHIDYVSALSKVATAAPDVWANYIERRA